MARVEVIGNATLYCGDMLAVLPTLAEDSIDAGCTDAPYHLTSIVKRFGQTSLDGQGTNEARARAGADGMARMARGFMGKQWDGGDIAFRVETWAAVYRVLKPGAHLVAFGGTRGHHRMFCAIEDAGFEIRDCVSWLYGSGFPKSHNIGNGWGTALKPAWEPICLARKPFKGTVAGNVLQHGTGGLHIEACRVASDDDLNGGTYSGSRRLRSVYTSTDSDPAAVPLNRLANGAGEFVQPAGRWPANVIHDGSEEVLAAFPDAPGQQASVTGKEPSTTTRHVLGLYNDRAASVPRGDEGSAARFFYTAKADAEDRLGSKHPTVKPVDLMRWLVRLVTPVGGTVIDPFAGTGTTGQACLAEGFNAILIEREEEYFADMIRRMQHVHGTDTPLFTKISA